MTRLIDADYLIKELEEWQADIDDAILGRQLGVTDAIVIACQIPTIDAVPVRHGKWLPENRTMDAFWVCSCCGFPSEAHGAFKIYKFCPNCGAKMDEEKK